MADEQLGSKSILEFQGHLRECAGCRNFLDNIYRVRDLIRTAEIQYSSSAVSPAFSAAISKRLGGEHLFPARAAVPTMAPPAPQSFWRHFSGAAAAAVLLLAVGWSWYSLVPPEGGAPVATSPAEVQEKDEGSMASYVRQHALHTMDETLLGPPDGIELASFETFGPHYE
jgi:anti-sigma-K factor RskA